jgi:hypothetical protein
MTTTELLERVMRELYEADLAEGGTTASTFEEYMRERDAMAAELERGRTIGDFERGDLEPEGRMQ